MTLRAAPSLERIITDPSYSFRCHVHDFPCEIARWNYHPEHEIHLIRRSSGRVFVGDYIGQFSPGHLAFINSGMPHNWISDLAADERVIERDLVIQFHPTFVQQIAELLPEARQFPPVTESFDHSWEFQGSAAIEGALLMESIHASVGLARLGKFLELLHLIGSSRERVPLASPDYIPTLDRRAADVVHGAISLILTELPREIRLNDVATAAGMTSSGFSRFFKRHTGHKFVSYVRKLRIGHACRLLSETDLPVTEICFQVGYANISNFNRNFRIERGLSPSAYRRLIRKSLAVG